MTVFSGALYHKAIKHLEKIPKNDRRTISSKIDGLKINPRPPISLKLVNEELYRMRVRNYRVLYTIDDTLKEVTVIAVKHRPEAGRQIGHKAVCFHLFRSRIENRDLIMVYCCGSGHSQARDCGPCNIISGAKGMRE